jgi:flagellar basal body rod protein FlgC
MGSLTGIAVSGLQSATSALDESATRIAAATSTLQSAQALETAKADAAQAPAQPPPQAAPATDAEADSRLDSTLVGLSSKAQQPDLASALTDQSAAAAAYRANLATLRTADQITQATLELKT